MDATHRLHRLSTSIGKLAGTHYLDGRIQPCIDDFRDDVYKSMGAAKVRDWAQWGDHEFKLEIGLGKDKWYCGVIYAPQDPGGGETIDSFDCSSMTYREIGRRAEKTLERYLATGRVAAAFGKFDGGNPWKVQKHIRGFVDEMENIADRMLELRDLISEGYESQGANVLGNQRRQLYGTAKRLREMARYLK